MLEQEIIDRYKDLFNNKPEIIVKAPGRVNLIGEHTDYNGGYVLPIAIDKYITIAACRRNDCEVDIHSINFNDDCSANFENGLKPNAHKPWANYFLGVVSQLLKRGYSIKGVDAAIYGDIPLGAGLSSSAAYEVAAAYMFQKLFDIEISGEELAEICQHAEHEFVGSQCGIMDQFISRFGKKDHALLIDCLSLKYHLIPFILKDYSLVVVNSNVKHNLAQSEYNTRREECGEAIRFLRNAMKRDIVNLRECSIDDYENHKDDLPFKLRKRAYHVITENQRVLDAVSALKENDLEKFGQLMYESHNSLRDNYEVSCKEIDTLVELARECEGVIGSRITGGGFGGCTVSIVSEKKLDLFTNHVKTAYKVKTDMNADIFIFKAEDGVSAELY